MMAPGLAVFAIGDLTRAPTKIIVPGCCASNAPTMSIRPRRNGANWDLRLLFLKVIITWSLMLSLASIQQLGMNTTIATTCEKWSKEVPFEQD